MTTPQKPVPFVPETKIYKEWTPAEATALMTEIEQLGYFPQQGQLSQVYYALRRLLHLTHGDSQW